MDFKRAVSEEEGSATLEFLGMVPLVFMVMMIAWQFVVGVHGVIVAQSAVNEAAKVYSITGEWTEARAAAQSTVNPISYLQLKSADTAMTGDSQFNAKVSVDINLVFLPDMLFPNGKPSIPSTSEASGKVIE